jgi:DNA repair photolyase
VVIVKEICAKSVLSKSKVFDYTVNPYIGCEHGCSYCYARFVRRFTGHQEEWGKFVDVKINAADLLQREIKKRQRGRVWISGLCDPYQPLEERYRLTRKCLEILLAHGWPLTIQTKSGLVLRDVELLKASKEIEVGLTVTTAEERMRRVFEPHAPPIKERINALERLHLAGIRTYAMIAPVLPKAEGLAAQLSGKIDYAVIDRMNYHYADWVYRKHGLEQAIIDDFFIQKGRELAGAFESRGIECELLF